jgi:hypothetical protein
MHPRMHLTRRRIRLELLLEALPLASFAWSFVTPVAQRIFLLLFYFPCIVIFMYFSFYFVFCFVFWGFNLPAMMWSNLEDEIVDGGRPLAPIWFFVVLALQLSLCSDGCFTRIRLFTEFPCNLYCLVQPWNRPGLLMVLLESLVITIARYLVLLD